MKRTIRTAIALVLTAAALWLSFRHIDLAELLRSFGRARPAWVAAAAGNTILSVYFFALRWGILLGPRGRISGGRLFRYNIISQTINIAVPARLGDLARTYMAAKEGGMPVAFVLGTLLAERLLDASVFAGLALAVPAILAAGTSLVSRGALFALLAFPILFLATLVWRPEIYARIARGLGRIAPAGWAARIDQVTADALGAFSALRRSHALAGLGLWTVLLILSQVLTNLLIFRAAGLALGFGAGMLVLLAAQIVSLPPSAPGKIGVFEYGVIVALALFGVPAGDALFTALLLHAAVFLPKILLGFVFLAGGKSRVLLREARESAGRR